MLDRYAREEICNVFSEKMKFDTWLQVELLVCEAWSMFHVIPKEDVEKLKENATYSIKRIHELEKETRHDVIAFTRCVSESLKEEKKWIHYGLTSSDVVDTAYGYMYKKANEILHKDIELLMEVLKEKALLYKDVVCMGRTHGIHAEITTFGCKFALWYAEMQRNLKRFEEARKDIECGKISGAVGTFANTPAEVQDYVCEKLGIESSLISTQVLQRDRHAAYFATLALIASTLEKMATEIRHLQRSEVREVEEYFNKGQKGSSAMPHKRNPIASENICGCARIMRGYMVSSFENIALWHERDISHSSAERILSEDACTLLDYMLHRFTKVLQNLIVYPEKMKKNIEMSSGLIFSQRFVLKLVEKGLSREEAYDCIQPLAIRSWESEKSFKNLLLQDKTIISNLTKEEIEDCFDVKYALKNIDTIYKRVKII